MHEDFEVKYWTKQLGVSRDELQKAVEGRQFGRCGSQRTGGLTEARGMLAIWIVNRLIHIDLMPVILSL